MSKMHVTMFQQELASVLKKYVKKTNTTAVQQKLISEVDGLLNQWRGRGLNGWIGTEIANKSKKLHRLELVFVDRVSEKQLTNNEFIKLLEEIT